MPSRLGKVLQRFNGIVSGDGVRDDALYFDGHSLVVDLIGTDSTPGFTIRGLDASNVPSTILTIAKDGTVTYASMTISPGDLTISAGKLVMGAAASKLVPGATSFSIRNHADGADNLLISDAGAGTFRAGLSATSLTLTAAGSKIVPGATSFSVRNNADGADNLLIADDGTTTLRNALTLAAGGLTLANGGVTLTGVQTLMINGVSVVTVDANSIAQLRSASNKPIGIPLVAGASVPAGGATVDGGILIDNNNAWMVYYMAGQRFKVVGTAY